MILIALLAGAIGFVLGFVAGVVVMRIRTARPPQRPAERRLNKSQLDDSTYFDPYCNRTFTDDDEARSHAVERHNAPADGTAWRETYTAPENSPPP